MRNLKRALSLALASVMLFGMMVVGSSAAFSDADEIVNKEAVEITAGLGLFAGSDGKFDPKGTVTRAQMAAVIAKMFYGSDLNADTYKGGSQFSDTAAFEGGWAEGYINLGVEKGWFKGYGDGKFGPGNAVTTAEAVTMLINLLKVDAGSGTWPMTVMAAAEDIELFDLECELKPAPATNVALTRDQLAVMVWNALNYSADGVKGYELGGKTFDTMADAIAYANSDDETEFVDMSGTLVPVTNRGELLVTDIDEVKGATLAKEVFEISDDKGFITANQATGEKSTFVGDTYSYNIETGLDQYKHYVKVIYSERFDTEKKPGTTYAIVELADYVTVEKEISKKADYMAAFGSKIDDAAGVLGYSKDEFKAPVGTYVICNEEGNPNDGKIIAFIEPTTYTVGEVTAVVETAGKEYIKIGSKRYDNNEDKDVIVAYDGIAEDDIVVYNTIVDGQDNEMTFVFKPETISGKITKSKDAPLSGEYADRVWVDGKEYEMSDVDASALLDVYAAVKDVAANATKTYDVYLFEGKVIGFDAVAGSANIDEVIYVTNGYTDSVKGSYGDTGTKDYYYVQGVNAAGEEVNILVGIEDCADDAVNYPVIDTFGTGTWDHDEDPMTAEVVKYPFNAFYTFEKSEDKDQSKKDIMLPTAVIDEADFDVDEDDYFAAAVNSVGKLAESEFTKDSKFVNTDEGRVYLTAETKFFIVDDFDGIDELKVSVYTGVIAKDLTSADVDIIATEDENGNRYAQLVVIYAESGLAAEELIYVSAIAAADFSAVDGGFEVVAYFTETDEFKTIVVDDEPNAGFYDAFEIDEDGIYDLGTPYGEPTIGAEMLTGVVGSAISTEGDLDLDLIDASAAKIYDLRDPEVIEDSEVAEIATLKDLQLILKDKKHVYFDVIIDTEGEEDVVTHIFVTYVEYEVLDCAGNSTSPETWHEDNGETVATPCGEYDDDLNDVCDVCSATIEP